MGRDRTPLRNTYSSVTPTPFKKSAQNPIPVIIEPNQPTQRRSILHFSPITRSFKGNGHKRQIGPIGLEFADEKLNLVQLESKGAGDITVHARCSMAYPISRDQLMESPKTARALVHDALHEHNFQGRQIVSTVMSKDLRIMSISYRVDKLSDGEAILEQLQDRIDGTINDYVIDYLPVRSAGDDDDRQAMVALANRNAVLSYLDFLEQCKLKPLALEIGPSAIKRWISALSLPGSWKTILVINFGYTKSYITMVSGRRLLFDQSMNYGEKTILEHVAQILDLSYPLTKELVRKHGVNSSYGRANDKSSNSELNVAHTLAEIIKPKLSKLVDEINRALIYSAAQTRGDSVNHVVLLGSLARWQGLDRLLNELVELPIRSVLDPLLPFHNYADASNVKIELKSEPDIAIATGLALRGLIANA